MSATRPSSSEFMTFGSNTPLLDVPATTEPFLSSEFMTFGSNTPLLDVPAMVEPFLSNYDMHVNNLIVFLRNQLCIHLVYEGSDDIQQHVLQKRTYACSVYCKPKKILKDVFPVMIGSRLDLAIRHEKIQSFEEPFDLSQKVDFPFRELDIGMGFFIIGGFLRHLPYFYTSDPTNTHVIQKKIVRVYSYNAQDRGKELSLYVADTKNRKCGDVVIVHNDGSETDDDPNFFDHCPYPVHLTAYMNALHREERFDIDHLGNKIVLSPGHLFTRLFIKYLYAPLRDKDWKLIRQRTNLVCSSIDNGFLLHVLSRKTVYFKETKSAGKMTNEPQESHREIGANGEIYMEKNTGCYREVSTQTYPLNPFMLPVIVRQLSKKVKTSSIESFHPSYLYFFCILGIFETKNVGRTTMMVRDVIVSTCDDLDPVYHSAPGEIIWKTLRIEPQENSGYYVVVNEACMSVSKKCFDRIDLFELKCRFRTIECYVRGRFTIIRYKMGLIMKKIVDLPIFVTPYDAPYWSQRMTEGRCNLFSEVTSYIVDLNPFFKHTAFPKVILALNTLKNAVLATTPKYAHYFMDTVSTYYKNPMPDHRALLQPKKDGISKHFVLMLPHPTVAYMSFEGCTQEDCIVKRKDYRSLDCFRFYSLRLKINVDSGTWVTFNPVRGDPDPESNLLGTLNSGEPMEVVPFSIHVNCERVGPKEYRIYFNKTPFRIVQYYVAGNKLTISVEQEHESETGDKLCSLHGQKGVIRVMDRMPLMDGRVEPDLIINVYCWSRTTAGQFHESIAWGNGKDTAFVQTVDRKKINAKVFYGKTLYAVIVFFANERLFAPDNWKADKLTDQMRKGRSRNGGMKIGNMELNALRGLGVAAIQFEKGVEHSDIMHVSPTIAILKSFNLVKNEVEFYKFFIDVEVRPSILV